MKLRWSDGHSFAVEFECGGDSDFYQRCITALVEARQRKIKHYHENGEDKMFFPPLYLHVCGADGHTWLQPSAMDHHTGVCAQHHIAMAGDEVNLADSFWLSVNQSRIWALCERTYLWTEEFERFCGCVGDMIMEMDQEIENGKRAVEQFEKMVAKNT